ncbi:MAG: hypothetical protein IID35_08055 [Planctomycetes bacterium]|nr:hypothetical protein [Planctomycetota bacterium]
MLSSLFTLILAASDTGGLLSNQAVIAGMAIAGTILVMRATRKNWTRSKQSAQQSVEPTRERFAKLKVEKAATRELEDAMYELDQLSRQVHGRLDTKFAKLEMVIRDADERIDKLSRLVRSAAGTQTLDVTLVEEDPHVTVPRDATHTPSPLSREGNRGGDGRNEVDVDPPTADRTTPSKSEALQDATTDDSATDDAAADDATTDDLDTHVELFRLDASGLSPVEIAQRIGRTAGEVELILSLRRMQQQAAGAKA